MGTYLFHILWMGVIRDGALMVRGYWLDPDQDQTVTYINEKNHECLKTEIVVLKLVPVKSK